MIVMAQSSTFKVEELKQWFKNTVHQFPNLGFADDDPEEQYIAQYSVRDSELLDIIRLSESEKTSKPRSRLPSLQNDLIFNRWCYEMQSSRSNRSTRRLCTTGYSSFNSWGYEIK